MWARKSSILFLTSRFFSNVPGLVLGGLEVILLVVGLVYGCTLYLQEMFSSEL